MFTGLRGFYRSLASFFIIHDPARFYVYDRKAQCQKSVLPFLVIAASDLTLALVDRSEYLESVSKAKDDIYIWPYR